MSITFAEIQELAVLSQGRNPDFTEVVTDAVAPNGPPDSLTDGAFLDDVILAVVLADSGPGNVATLEITTVDDTATYTVRLGGLVYSFSGDGGGETANDLLSGLATQILQSSLYTAAVNSDDQLVITRVDGDAFSCYFEAGGSAVVSASRNAGEVRFRLWGLPKGQSDWYVLPVEPDAGDIRLTSLHTRRRWSERYAVAGLQRLYVEIVETDGTVSFSIGPCKTS